MAKTLAIASLPRPWVLLLAGLFAATALASCGGGRVHTKEDMQSRKRDEAKAREAAERAALEAQDAQWKGATVGLEEEFQLLDTDTVKLDNAYLFANSITRQTPKQAYWRTIDLSIPL